MNTTVDGVVQDVEVWWNTVRPPQVDSVWLILAAVGLVLLILTPWIWKAISSFIELADYFWGVMTGSNGYDSAE